MNKTEAIALLRENKYERGIEHWNRRPRTLKSFGIGLTKLRKLAKQIGRDHKLALKLWNSDIYDARVVGSLIDEPKLMTREQVEEQVEELSEGYLAHVFATCGATLTKTSFVFDLCRDWMDHSSAIRRQCGFALLYELSKFTKQIEGMDEDFFMERVRFIQDNIHGEEMWVRESMNSALMGIGSPKTGGGARRTRSIRAAIRAGSSRVSDQAIDRGS